MVLVISKFRAFHLAKLSIIRFLFFIIVFSAQQTLAETINLVAEVFPPQTNRDGTGQQFDVARAIFEPLGYTVNVNVYPYIHPNCVSFFFISSPIASCCFLVIIFPSLS